jgi:hypothetical protein
MHWAEFESEAPALAQLGKELFARDQVALIGTIRRDGSPRISPVEPDITNGRLYMGMMWKSLKALDLMRDPRCTVHALIHDRFGEGGEFKLHGRALEISDLDERKLYGDAIYARLGWRPEEPSYHLFAIELFSAGSFFIEGDARLFTLWRAGEPPRRFLHQADDQWVPLP